MCMQECDSREDFNDQRSCEYSCMFRNMREYKPYQEQAIASTYGYENYETCMQECDSREDFNDRCSCGYRCMFDNMSGSRPYQEESVARTSYETCMQECDSQEDSNDRRSCGYRCMFKNMGGSYPGSYNKEEAIARSYGSGNFQMSRCMDDCDRREDSDKRQRCRNRCFSSMSGRNPGSFNKEEAIARSYGSGNYEMCMRNCDRRDDSNDRQRCRNRCSSMFESGDFNKEE